MIICCTHIAIATCIRVIIAVYTPRKFVAAVVGAWIAIVATFRNGNTFPLEATVIFGALVVITAMISVIIYINTTRNFVATVIGAQIVVIANYSNTFTFAVNTLVTRCTGIIVTANITVILCIHTAFTCITAIVRARIAVVASDRSTNTLSIFTLVLFSARINIIASISVVVCKLTARRRIASVVGALIVVAANTINPFTCPFSAPIISRAFIVVVACNSIVGKHTPSKMVAAVVCARIPIGTDLWCTDTRSTNAFI
jgi:hypothetical protein